MRITAAQIRRGWILLECVMAAMIGVNLGFIVSVIWLTLAR